MYGRELVIEPWPPKCPYCEATLVECSGCHRLIHPHEKYDHSCTVAIEVNRMDLFFMATEAANANAHLG